MIIRDSHSRYAWMYFIYKSDSAETFSRFLSDLRLEGVPYEVVLVRSGEFSAEIGTSNKS